MTIIDPIIDAFLSDALDLLADRVRVLNLDGTDGDEGRVYGIGEALAEVLELAESGRLSSGVLGLFEIETVLSEMTFEFDSSPVISGDLGWNSYGDRRHQDWVDGISSGVSRLHLVVFEVIDDIRSELDDDDPRAMAMDDLEIVRSERLRRVGEEKRAAAIDIIDLPANEGRIARLLRGKGRTKERKLGPDFYRQKSVLLIDEKESRWDWALELAAEIDNLEKTIGTEARLVLSATENEENDMASNYRIEKEENGWATIRKTDGEVMDIAPTREEARKAKRELDSSPVVIQKASPTKGFSIPAPTPGHPMETENEKKVDTTKRPSRFEVMFPLLKNGATKTELIEACIEADRTAGVEGRSKPDGTVHGFLCHLRHGRVKSFPGSWDTFVSTNESGETVYQIRKHKGEGLGEKVVRG